jgi:hypothetical protein
MSGFHPARDAAIGLRARTNRAIVVALSGSRSNPAALMRAEVVLAAPDVPATVQPYHHVMEMPWAQAVVAVQEAAAAIEAVAVRAVADLVQNLAAEGVLVRAAGIVGAPERRLESIGNLHIRAHAAEGVLFRRVLQVAAEVGGLRVRAYAERGFDAAAALELKRPLSEVKTTLARIGAPVGSPWRADEKLAALAAWLVLPAQTDAVD